MKSSTGSRRFILATAVIAALVVGFVYRATFLFLGALFLGFVVLASTVRRAWIPYAIAHLLLALAVTELYFGFEQTREADAFPNTTRSQDGLGFANKPGAFRAVKRYGFGAGTVYDVRYSIDEHGLRVTPASSGRPGPPVMFFGNSFTFGTGVEDDETLPNAFAILSGMRVLNFAVAGYGPHHTLRLLELGIPKRIEPESPRWMVFTMIADHLDRAAGRSDWDQDGPLYEIEDGRARYVGSFAEQGRACRPAPVERSPLIHRILAHSRTWQTLVAPVARFCAPPADPDALEGDRLRLLAIFEAADAIAQASYRSRLVVFLWDVREKAGTAGERTFRWLEAKLSERGIPVFSLSSATGAGLARHIIERDGHPDAAAYREAARALLSWLERDEGLAASRSR